MCCVDRLKPQPIADIGNVPIFDDHTLEKRSSTYRLEPSLRDQNRARNKRRKQRTL